jgi:hypothetical protein
MSSIQSIPESVHLTFKPQTHALTYYRICLMGGEVITIASQQGKKMQQNLIMFGFICNFLAP